MAKTRTRKNKPAKPGAKRARRNPGEDSELDQAAALYESFHGKPASKVREFQAPDTELTLAELGMLRYLIVRTPLGKGQLTFSKATRVCSSVSGRQLYFIGGDQSIDLDSLGLEDQAGRDHIEIGPCVEIEYHTRKGFHDFAPVDYYHKFGEEDGKRPTLCYDAISENYFLVGGNYEVKPEGIVN
jgi:hypothetical protein